MRTITTTTTAYTFDELTDSQKQHAIDNLYAFNVDCDWWDGVYEDAATIGLKITSFDLGRAQEITGDFLEDAHQVATQILKEHGDSCDTHQTALDYLEERKRLLVEQCQDEADFLCIRFDTYCREIFEYEYYDIDTEEIDKEFLNSLLGDYFSSLRREHEYLTSEEAIVETIEANEYEFTENGDLI